jgi:hypothetical protein
MIDEIERYQKVAT